MYHQYSNTNHTKTSFCQWFCLYGSDRSTIFHSRACLLWCRAIFLLICPLNAVGYRGVLHVVIGYVYYNTPDYSVGYHNARHNEMVDIARAQTPEGYWFASGGTRNEFANERFVFTATYRLS